VFGGLHEETGTHRACRLRLHGRTHALGFRTVGGVFDLALTPVLEVLADANEDLARNAAARLGFARSTGDWRALVADAAVDVVDITAPNLLHAPIALAAIAAGKPVYCEKPLAPTAVAALEMVQAAERAGIVTQVGFNYICNPMLALAHEMIASGELGQIWSFRGIHAEDFMIDRQSPWTWRLDPAGGAGAIADIGSHIIGIARFLLGPISALCADVETVIPQRALPGGGAPRAVEVDDQARMLLRFARGCRGVIETSWLSSGRKMQLEFEVIGEKGALVFSQERFNELRYYRSSVTDRATVSAPSWRGRSTRLTAPPASRAATRSVSTTSRSSRSATSSKHWPAGHDPSPIFARPMRFSA
jgi:predicted dehydrogenase